MFLKKFKDFEIHTIEPSNENKEIIDFMREYFNINEPFLKFKLSKGLLEDVEASDQDFMDVIEEGMSISIIAPNKDLVAVSLAGFLHPNDKFLDKKNFKYPLSFACIDMLEEGMKKADLFNRFQVDRVFVTHAIAVASKYLGNGLGKVLLKENEEQAKQNGCKVIFSHCVSPYSSKIFKDLNWILAKEIDWDVYFSDKNKEFFDWEPPYGKYEFWYKIFNE